MRSEEEIEERLADLWEIQRRLIDLYLKTDGFKPDHVISAFGKLFVEASIIINGGPLKKHGTSFAIVTNKVLKDIVRACPLVFWDDDKVPDDFIVGAAVYFAHCTVIGAASGRPVDFDDVLRGRVDIEEILTKEQVDLIEKLNATYDKKVEAENE